MSVLLAFTLRENSDLNISSHFCLPSSSLHMGLSCWVVVGASVDGQWQEWSSWSDCSVTCANGTQQRTRQCSAAAHGGSECRGHWAESRECHNPDCTGKILSLLILYLLWCLNSKIVIWNEVKEGKTRRVPYCRHHYYNHEHRNHDHQVYTEHAAWYNRAVLLFLSFVLRDLKAVS